MKKLKDLLEQSKQKSFRLGNVFAEGDWIESSTGDVGKIHRRGVNYIIAVTNEGKMFRAWVKDIKEHCGCEDDSMSDKEKVKAFINKNRKKISKDQ